MKKTIIIFLTFSFFLVGCHQEKFAETSSQSNTHTVDTHTLGEHDATHEYYKETEDFGFTLLCYDTEFSRGKTVWLKVEVTNLTNETITTQVDGLVAGVHLSCKSYKEKYYLMDEYTIHVLYLPLTDSSMKKKVAPGEKSGAPSQGFFIPEHAIPGSYSLICSYGGSKVEFENVFTLAEDVFPLD